MYFTCVHHVPPGFLGPCTTNGESGPGQKAATHGSISPWKGKIHTQMQQPMGTTYTMKIGAKDARDSLASFKLLFEA